MVPIQILTILRRGLMKRVTLLIALVICLSFATFADPNLAQRCSVMAEESKDAQAIKKLDYSDLESRIDDLEYQVRKLKSTVSDLEYKVSDLESRIDDLESQK
jgi:septal ring factor EnvC (AmiA/AmiB activator)